MTSSGSVMQGYESTQLETDTRMRDGIETKTAHTGADDCCGATDAAAVAARGGDGEVVSADGVLAAAQGEDACRCMRKLICSVWRVADSCGETHRIVNISQQKTKPKNFSKPKENLYRKT